MNWTHEPLCPICQVLETVDHALEGCRFHPIIADLFEHIWAPMVRDNKQHSFRKLPAVLTLSTPQGIMLWTARAAHCSLRCAVRQNVALASFDAFLQRRIELVDRVSGWQGLSPRADDYLSFKNVLLQFQTTGALPVEELTITRPGPTTPEREKKRHKAEHKQKLAEAARLLLEQLEGQGYSIAWTDGSAKWEGRKGWVGGYRATILGEWEECAPLPTSIKQTIN